MRRFTILLFACLLLGLPLHGYNVGLLIMATGKYAQFVDPLIQSARIHFCSNHHVTYFVFTDGMIPESSDTVCTFQERLGWPYDTMMRTHVYFKHASLLLSQDYLFACDADMLFVDTVGDEILGERVATLHPGFVGMRGSYCKNPRSLSHVDKWEGKHYFAGGFYGGSTAEMMRIAHTLSTCIDEDLRHGIIAEWHDEAHWNRYCIDYPPTVILTPSYCYPEKWKLKFPKKLLALDKNHAEIRKSE